MSGDRTTVAVQRYLDVLKRDDADLPREAVVRDLLGRSVRRLRQLCAGLLYRRYPRLARGPLNLNPDEMLSAVVERLIKAMREVRPHNARAFFALANQHMRWELNDVARRLDQGVREVGLDGRDPALTVWGDETSGTGPSPDLGRILRAIEGLPEVEREVFGLVRIQGLTQVEAAEILGVSVKTVQRKLGQCIAILAEQLRELGPARPEKSTG